MNNAAINMTPAQALIHRIYEEAAARNAKQTGRPSSPLDLQQMLAQIKPSTNRVRTHLRPHQRYVRAVNKVANLCALFPELRRESTVKKLLSHFQFGTALPWKFWTKHHRAALNRAAQKAFQEQIAAAQAAEIEKAKRAAQ